MSNGENQRKNGKMKTLSSICAVGAMSIGLMACSSQSTGSSTTKSAASNSSAFQERGKVIGYSTFDLKQPYWQDFKKGIEEAAAAKGYKVVTSDEKGSQETQVSGSMNLINQNISALIVSPVQPSALPATETSAHNAKIPVVIGDIGAQGNYDAYVLSDNKGGGAQAADYVNKTLGTKSGTKEVGVIQLHPGSAVGEDRVNGFVDKLKTYSGFKVVGQLNGNDSVDGGFQVTQSLLTSNPNISVIFAANDPEAEGAVQALKQANRLTGDKKVTVVGFNGDAPALDLIKQGEMAATVAQHPIDLGKMTVQISFDLLNGKKVSFTDQAKKVYNVPTTLVDSSNVASFMK